MYRVWPRTESRISHRPVLASVAAAVIVCVLSSCATSGTNRVPSYILELEREATLDERATSTCEESSPNPGPIIASADSTAGEIRVMYEQDEVFEPSSLDALPADPQTYAAICIRDTSGVEGSSFDRGAVWVSFDGEGGGVMPIAMWRSVDFRP